MGLWPVLRLAQQTTVICQRLLVIAWYDLLLMIQSSNHLPIDFEKEGKTIVQNKPETSINGVNILIVKLKKILIKLLNGYATKTTWRKTRC